MANGHERPPGHEARGNTGERPRDQLRPLSMGRNFSWTLVGNVCYGACHWAMVVVLSKVGTAAMVGQFALGMAVCAPVVAFSRMALLPVQVSDARREHAFGDYLGLRLITTALAMAAIAAIAVGAGYRWAAATVILAAGSARGVESISQVFHGLFQQNERLDLVAKSRLLKGPASLLGLAAGVLLTGGVFWGVAGLALAWLLVLLAYEMPRGKFIQRALGQADAAEPASLRPRWEWARLKGLAVLALPLAFTMMFIALTTNIPRYFIERYHGERLLGIFAAMAYVMIAGSVVIRALQGPAAPRLARYYAAGDLTAFGRLLLRFVAIAAAVGGTGVAVALVAGRQVLTLLYRPEYGEYADVFVWIMVAGGLAQVANVLGHGITATRAFRRFVVPYFCVAVIAAGSSAALIPRFGLLGAALTLCAVGAASCVVPVLILLAVRRQR